MSTEAVQPSPVETARQTLASAQEALQVARGELNAAQQGLATIKPEDHSTPASYAKELKSARAAVSSAEDAVRFYESKVSDATAKLAPLELNELQEGVKCALLAQSVAVTALRDALHRLVDQLGGIRESIALIRETQAQAERDFAELGRRGANPQRLPEDELAQLVCRRLEEKLDAPSTALGAALAIWKFFEEAPRRAAERAEMQKALELDRKLRYDDECRRGIHGEQERERAIKEAVASEKRFHGNVSAVRQA